MNGTDEELLLLTRPDHSLGQRQVVRDGHSRALAEHAGTGDMVEA